jgi:hypothetical protein
MKINKFLFGLITMATAFGAVHAENNTLSPYSRYGYGLLGDYSNTMQKAMGGVGYAMRSGRQINFMNPASYAAMDSLTFLFDMGADVKVLKTTDSGESGSNFTGGLNYISMQVPITKWLGASAGLLPYSQVGYSFGDEIANGTNSHSGSGSINEVYLGFGATPLKGLSLGVNASYMFGTLLNNTYVYGTGDDDVSSSTSLFEQVIEVRDYNLRFGVQYSARLNEDNRLTLGAVYSPKKTFRGNTYGIKYDVANDTAPDTISSGTLKGNAQMAETWGVGLNYEWKGRLQAEVDFTYQPWKGMKYLTIEGFNAGAANFDNRWKVSAGVQYINRPRGSWLQRVNYRLGAYYCNDYIMVGSNNVREKGVSLGFGLPVPSAKTMVNLTFEYKNRQANPTPLVKENYFVVTLGLNFNELWFWRNRLN